MTMEMLRNAMVGRWLALATVSLLSRVLGVSGCASTPEQAAEAEVAAEAKVEAKVDFGAEAKKPNIIFLFADDQNTLSVGIYGNPEVQTPHMDQIGRDGVTFDRHYNTTAICMASRANVFTGMYEYKTGTNFGHGDMKPEVWAKSYPILMREAGYYTAFAGKFGMLVEGKGLCESDFDKYGGGPGQTSYKTAQNETMAAYAEEYPHSTLSYGAFGRDAIREAVKQDKPFCVSISYKAPHRPVQPDPKFDDVYAGKTFTKPDNYGRAAGEHMSAQSKQGRQWGRFSGWGYDDRYDKVMARYYQLVYAIDQSIAMIRDELEAQGIADNTIIIYASDNGFICGSHGYGSKVLPMEESSRAPLMIYDPRMHHGQPALRTEALTGNIDLTATMLEMAGLEIPENVDGVSLVPLLTEPDQDVRDQLAFINVWGALPTKSLSAFTKDWKYTYWWYGDDTMEPVEELYHVAEDPSELVNLAQDPAAAEALQEMRRRYDAELAKWRVGAVPYNNYQPYGDLFDRTVPWREKSYKPFDKSTWGVNENSRP